MTKLNELRNAKTRQQFAARTHAFAVQNMMHRLNENVDVADILTKCVNISDDDAKRVVNLFVDEIADMIIESTR